MSNQNCIDLSCVHWFDGLGMPNWLLFVIGLLSLCFLWKLYRFLFPPRTVDPTILEMLKVQRAQLDSYVSLQQAYRADFECLHTLLSDIANSQNTLSKELVATICKQAQLQKEIVVELTTEIDSIASFLSDSIDKATVPLVEVVSNRLKQAKDESVDSN